MSPSDIERGRRFCGRTCSERGQERGTRGPHNSLPTDVRLWRHIDRSGGVDDCWPWIARARTKAGYGLFSVRVGDDWVQVTAHRVALILSEGRSDDEAATEPRQACHACDNPPCCNPAHLFWGTSADNHADMWAKGRAAPVAATRRQGSKNGNAKISESDVPSIRRRIEAGETDGCIAHEYSVSGALIWNIRNGKSWRHVD